MLCTDKTHSNKTKVFMLVCTLVTCCGMFYHLEIFTVAQQYFKYQYEEVEVSGEGRPAFPDITVCNMDATNSER